ncbi:unnamed protein product, partial [Timema podura]|nr:unnamed protein product [Timema podura]
IKDPRDVALHFNPRFEDSVIVRNWMANGEWGEEEREGPMVLKPGSDFRVDILCEEDGFKEMDCFCQSASHNHGCTVNVYLYDTNYYYIVLFMNDNTTKCNRCPMGSDLTTRTIRDELTGETGFHAIQNTKGAS